MEWTPALVIGAIAVMVFAGGAVLLRWYDRSVLGNPPSRWDWIWPGLLALAIVVFGLVRSRVGMVAMAGIVGIAALAQYRAYRRRDLDS